ncbi:MerR family transcriptional regulator [Sporosarcina pasteurii]|uniref:Multidrug transporter activation protein n=1 Tax=Sporosarcina pasteurii TaxID=1474 RepID=A0A380CHZ9_SPOPA|nr:MerR family transcriptional regulator [Sporosarcina pasteurii]MDS9472058.1 MerR family transcriptional regulator [Sporosarcina pasteurii]QBQ07185.1 MerR family transcriptional regulator [Sporosarcina pasteurii]SUJ20902.1 Multidrug transporter activation protein [Sporosarcina pasteurii]
MKVKEVAELTGISVRTLHHYDAIGLLTPDAVTEAGYRLYSDDNLATLQQILFFRELGFPLMKIKELLDSPTFDRQEAFELQHQMLLEKRRKLDEMIETIEKTIQQGKGELIMSNEEKFKGFDFNSNPYEQEARARWGDKAVDKANQFTKEQGDALGEEMNRIYFMLAKLRHESPESEEAQKAIGEWYDFLNKMGNYSPEAFAGLGQVYVDDERFTKNIDQFGEGLAVFMRDAMAVYAQKLKG